MTSEFFNFSNEMLANLFQVSLKGGLLILALWSLCRLFPRLPAALRCWA